MVWILLLGAVPGEGPDSRERLTAAIRDSSVAGTHEALADLLKGSHARAARAILASLPRARDRMAACCAATVQARLDYDRADTDFAFNSFDERIKQQQLDEALRLIRETGRMALDAEQVYDSLREAMASLGPEGTAVLAAEAERASSWLLKCELLEGLGAAGAREPLLKVLDRAEPPVVLATALAGAAHERAASFLAHPQWQVRLAALRGLKGVRAAAGPIIERMAEPDARFRREAGAALRELTGTNLPSDPGVWRDWWKANGEDFRAGTYNPLRPRVPEGPGRTTFFEIPIYSSRVCFVIDRSASMSQNNRFGSAKKELKRLLGEMPDGCRVNLLFFGEDTACFARNMRTLDAAARRDAGIFIDRQLFGRGTDLYRALEKALAMVGSPETGVLREDGPDTIVVLSDGQATVGRLVNDDLVGRVIARRARYLRPVIHTISLSSDARSMKLLAELTGGEYRMQP